MKVSKTQNPQIILAFLVFKKGYPLDYAISDTNKLKGKTIEAKKSDLSIKKVIDLTKIMVSI